MGGLVGVVRTSPGQGVVGVGSLAVGCKGELRTCETFFPVAAPWAACPRYAVMRLAVRCGKHP